MRHEIFFIFPLEIEHMFVYNAVTMKSTTTDNHIRRLIFHIDVNSAFLSWEAVYRLHHLGETLDLRTVPAIIGGNQASRHGIVLAASIPAKRLGVKTAMAVAEVRRMCPDIIVAPPRYELYVQCSEAFIGILKEVCPIVEQYSIDEAFCEMTGIAEAENDPVGFANRLRIRIREELGFTVNIGISVNRLLAKMASDFRKPDLVHTLWPTEIPDKMWPLPAKDLFFIGHATEKKLADMGIHTIGEVASTPPEILQSSMKLQGLTVWQFANGIDSSPVIDNPPPNKGYGNSTTVSHDVTTASEAHRILLSLCETVSARLRADGVRIQVVSVSIRSFDLSCYSHQTVLSTPTDITKELHACACRLFDACWTSVPIRSLGVHTSRISHDRAPRQLCLFDTDDYEKLSRVDQTVDSIRKRYGNAALVRASLLPEPSYRKKEGDTRADDGL